MEIMKFGISMPVFGGMELGTGGSGGSGPTVLNAAYIDDFTSVSGTLNGRTITGLVSYTTVIESSPGGSTVNALNVTTTGTGKLAGTSGATAAHGYRNPATVYDYSRIRLNGGGTVEFHVSANGTTFNGVKNVLASGINMAITPYVAGSAGTAHTITGETPRAGDFVDTWTEVHGGIPILKTYNNGNLCGVTSGQFIHCSFNGTINAAGDTLTVNSITSGALGVGMMLYNATNVFGDRVITAQIDATHYTISGGPLVTGLTVTGVALTATWGGLSLTAASVTANGQHGVNGGLGSTGIDSFEGGDMAAVSRILLTRPGRVQQVESDGTLVYRGTFQYTGTQPTALKYRIRLGSDNSIVASGTLTTFTTDDTAKTGTYSLPAFTPATLSTLYWHQIYREDAVDALGAAAEISGASGTIAGGFVIGCTGQSLATQANAASTSTTTYPAVNGVFNVNANPNTNRLVRSNNAFNAYSANSPKAAFAGTLLPAIGGGTPPFAFISGGLGGTSVADRVPGVTDTGVHQVLRTSLIQQGCKPYCFIHIDGQSDTGAIVTYSTKLPTIYTDLATVAGGTFPVFMIPVGGQFNSSEAGTETMRRYQTFELPATDARYRVGAFIMDLQHFTSPGADDLHLSNEGYVEMYRRCALAIANYANPGSYPNDRNGISLAGLVRIDDSTLDVTVNMNGAASVILSTGMGTNGKIDQYNGGLRFGTAVGTSAGVTKADGVTAISTITTEVYPIAIPTIGTVSGGQCVLRFTFAPGTFPGTAYMGGPWGRNPFNRTNDPTINQNYLTQASIIYGVTTGETANVAIQPHYHSSGNDYFSAS